MNNHISTRNFFIISLIGIASLLLAACNGGQPVSTPALTPQVAATATPTDTPQPTLTATPEQPLVILLAPEKAESSLVNGLQGLLEELSSQNGMRFQMRQHLAPIDLGDEVRIVVAVPPATGLAELAASAKDVQFLGLMIPGLEPDSNLSVISSQADRADILGFAAGYIAAETTLDWRVGVISSQDTPAGNAARLSFANGVMYLCGLCRPVYPPFPASGYPIAVQLPQSTALADWQPTINNFQVWGVSTVYVAPEMADAELLKALGEAGINLIGTGKAPAGLAPNWVASLGQGDPLGAVREIWSSLVQSQQGQHLSLPVTIEAGNPELFSPGKQQSAGEMLADLLAGFIDTGVDPTTGESSWSD